MHTTLDLNIIHYKEIEMTGSYWVGVPPYGNPDLYGVALKLIQNGTVPVGKLTITPAVYVSIGLNDTVRSIGYGDSADPDRAKWQSELKHRR